MKIKHYNIPVFIPELACPNQCIYCNQRKISGTLSSPTIREVEEIIETHLETIPKENSHIEIAFFGGSFTGIDIDLQKEYLQTANKYVLEGKVKGIRLSTRPDYINEDILKLLKEYNVKSIELGAQSLDADVLIKTERGHTIEDVEKASKLINEYGFELGLQMMIGLPEDTKEKSLNTAKKIIKLGAKTTRIYPTLIIKDTKLEQLYNDGLYKPLSIEEAVDWTKDLVVLFEKSNVNILRIGLHATEELSTDKSLIAGPYHPSFKEFVMTEIWSDIFKSADFKNSQNDISLTVHPSQKNYAVGFKAKNKNYLLEKFKSIKIVTDNSLKKYEYHVCNN